MPEVERRWVILRHAPARTRDFSRWPDDVGRPLKPSGRKEFHQAAQGLAHLLEARGQVATSPLRRASETTDLLAEAWPHARSPQVWNELQPEGSLPTLFSKALQVRGQGDLVLVGHEPELSRFVGYCVTGEGISVVKLTKGGVVALDFPGSVRPGGGRLLWVLTRNQLRKLGARSTPRRGAPPARPGRKVRRRARAAED
jgi:phosphohistidine phosphatase